MKKLILFVTLFLPAVAFSALPPNFKVTNEMIYQKLVEIEKRQAVFEERFKQIDKRFEQIDKRFEQIDKRFEQIDKRFEQIDKRFEQVDRRITELREDMNKRFEQVDKRFEQVDRRFAQIDKRFEEIITFMWMLVVVFIGVTGVTISFALWDRRTMIRPFEDKVKELEKEKIDKVIASLRKLAETDKKVAEVLGQFGLL